MANYVLGVTGGSGAPYTLRVLEGMLQAGHIAHVVFSEAGRKVFELELDLHLTGEPDHDAARLTDRLPAGRGGGALEVYRIDDFAASIASGSYPTAGMAIVPCSMGTLGRVAIGSGANLVERAADVTLKERRRLVLVAREAPLSLIHVRNMLAVTEAGAEVFPASPGFYHRPQRVQDLVDGIAGRVLERFGIESSFLQRWEGPASAQGKQAEAEV